jgi:UDP-N-acetylmuramyl pentapeptide phosphotransferase/UDP-N-acetylglucosamine-1-phosphate transferase
LPGLCFCRYKRRASHTTPDPVTLILLAISAATALATTLLVAIVRRHLLRREILDHPNARSSHEVPTPRGGGLGVMAALLPAWILVVLISQPPTPHGEWLIPLAALALAGVSWIDDLRTLGPLPRLGIQFAAALVGVLVLPGPVFQGLLPGAADAAIAAIGLVWFTNLFNFMDGIDGISGVEAIAIGIGIAAIGLVGEAPLAAWHGQALVVAAAAAGFLVWNWPPARIFLGDVGSVPMGFLAGWLLLMLAASGAWQAALILPLYYLGDATLTLFRRLLRGERVWQAHREHFYQTAVRRGLSHGRVSGAIALVNTALVALSIAAAIFGTTAAWLALAAAALLVAGLLGWLAGPRASANRG